MVTPAAPPRPPAGEPIPGAPPKRAGLGAGDLLLGLVALGLCGAVAGFFLLGGPALAPRGGDAPAVVTPGIDREAGEAPRALEQETVADVAEDVAAGTQGASGGAVPSIIIALPGDPILVKAAVRAVPRQVEVRLPAHLGAGASSEILAASVVTAPLVPVDGGFLGKFPAVEAGSEADEPEMPSLAEAFGIGAGGDVATVRETAFDEVALAPFYAWGGIGEREAEARVRAEAVRRGWLGEGCGAGGCGVLAPFARGDSRLAVNPGGGSAAGGSELILRPDREQKLGALLAAGNFTPDGAAAVEQGFASTFGIDGVFPGAVVIARGRLAGAGRYRPMQVSVYEGGEYVGSLAWADAGGYGPGEEPWRDLDLETAAPARFAPGGFDIADGIYSAAVRAGMPEPLIREAILAIAAKTDLKAPLGSADSVRILYAPSGGASGRILYVGLGRPGGDFDCYLLRPEAVSARRCIGRAGDLETRIVTAPSAPSSAPSSADVGGIFVPVAGSARLTSRFGPRMHPLLGYARLHKGVDWAAPTGRPIMSVADGTVIFAGVASGYGNHVRIRHEGGVMTTYSHLDRIETGMAPGVKVGQGTTIGYLGTTGLSTGPHLHFEYYLSGVPVDPLTHLKGGFTGGGGGGGDGGGGVRLDEVQVAAFERARQAVDAAVRAEPAVTATGVP